MKPGTWFSVFCADGGGLDATGKPVGYAHCFGGAHGHVASGGYYFDTMQTAVQNAFGANTPVELTDTRFYFQQWILALVKYLQSANDPNATLATIDANTIDANNLFFDSNGGGFETGEYVFRNFVNSNKQAPTAVEVTTNLLTSVINDFNFDRYNFRGEKALYSLLRHNQADQPGAEPILLTNMVGSSVLANAFGAYACATNADPKNANCGYNPQSGQGAVLGPVDPLGNEILAPYQDAFGQSIFHIAFNGQSLSNAPLKVNSTDFTLIQSAMATLPIWSNPWDPSTAKPNDPTVAELLPFLPQGSNVGFPVTIDGSRDKFYNTNSIDFTGVSVSANADFEYFPIATNDGGTQDITVVRAVETQNYLGQLFFCAEPNPATGQPDVLGVRMYDNAQGILTWIANHPSATTDCNIQIKYSIYGNYADFISSLTNGIRFGLNAGYGGSVVVDGTVFDPNVVASLGQ
jgi:hypothetical protein